MNEEILKELEIHNRKLISLFEKQNDGLLSLSGKIDELISKQYEVNFPKEIKAQLTNQKEVVFPQTQDVKIVNQQGYPTEIKISNLPKLKEYPSEIKVSNFPEPQTNKDLKSHLTKLFTGLWDATKEHTANIFITNKTPKEAIPVVLVDAEGRRKYTAIFSGGGSGAVAGGVSVVQYKENAVHTSGDTGIMGLGVRKDTPVALAADGDYQPFIFSDKGGLWTDRLPNEIDSGNSTTATLNSGVTFTGTGVNILAYAVVTITLNASHNSATDGMKFQFSTDNTNWDDIYNFTYTAADGARRFQFPVTSQYFRVVYTNGGTGQSHFRVQTILHHDNSLTTIHRLVDDTNNDRSAQIVKAAIIAQKAGGGPGAGDFVAVQSTAAGNLKMSVQEVSDGLDVGAGNAGSETQRVSIATNDVNLSAIKTAIEATLTVAETAPSTLVAFVTDIPTAGSRVQLATNTIIAGVLEAPSTNSGNVFIGGSNVSSTVFGSELQPGQSIGVAINNSDKIWIDAATSGDDVAFFGS